LVQELAATADAGVAGLAMAALAAQARFLQYQNRMELPLRDLPAELFHKALLVLKQEQDGSAIAERELRERYDEAAGRLALLARLVTAVDSKTTRALSVSHAGLSIFASALAHSCAQDRDIVVISLSGHQSARLALSLCAAGLSHEAVKAQFTYLHPDAALPEGLEFLRPDIASAMLASSFRDVAF